MAGRLFVILMCSFHQIQVQGQKPEISLTYFDGDHFLFTCSLPGSANDSTSCNLYFGETTRPVLTTTLWRTKSSPKQLFCQFTVNTDDFLRHMHFVQQKDASCDYSLGSERNSLSPRSDVKNLTDIVERESPTKPVFSTTTGLTVSRPHASTPVTPVKTASDIVEIVSTFTTTTGPTVSRTHAPTPVTPIKGLTAARPRNTKECVISTSLTSVKPASEMWIWNFVIVATGFGVTAGVILLGLALLCTKRRSGSGKLNIREPQNEDSELYHVYATISDEPAASALKEMVYSTSQLH
ncbi:uncharacterized protein LOC130184850 isoform X2 [Seriola aureovittata]|uniref:uncharacterized protein LOC130184850 isoform X2 n=1 Tax=Seriola aureovittata TaxID=2871759 RepID=UPI0024BDF2FE|nr:uncharacterized protein LOC130184850 isoform X2 [Seriola aureovittata]